MDGVRVVNQWSKQLADVAAAILGQHSSVEAAAGTISHSLGFKVTADSIKGAFRRLGMPAPGTFVSKASSTVYTAERAGQVAAAAKEPKIIVPPGVKPDVVPDHPLSASSSTIPRLLLCEGDNHLPIHDPYVEEAKLKFMQDVKPDHLVNVGDAFDFWPLSSHEKEPSRWYTNGRLQDEFDAGKPFWKARCALINGPIDFILGNHENRLYRFIGANLGLFGLEAFEWQTLASLPARIKVHPHDTQLKIGPMSFEHGDRIGGRFGVAHPAYWLLTNKGNRNTIFGHFHRMEQKFRTVYDELGEAHTYTAIAQGHGSLVKEQKYVYEPSWQHGFTVVEYWQEGDRTRFTAHPIIIVDGKFSWGGKVYDGGRPHTRKR